MGQDILNTLKTYGQDHLLQFWNELDRSGRDRLAAQLAEIDWPEMQRLISEYVLRKPVTDVPEDLSPAPYFPLRPRDEAQCRLYEQATAAGMALLRGGKVAALTVAGGQGTRLGFDGPKGTYPISPVKSKTLFQYFAETIARIGVKYGHPMRWYIMTSEMNNAATKQHFSSDALVYYDQRNE